MRPTVDALARRGRIVSYSLCDEPSSGAPCDPSLGFDNFVRQLDTVLDRAGLDRAVIAGVSFGGLIVSEFAARRPDRVAGLVFASALPPTWIPSARDRFYMRWPYLGTPAFILTSPVRLLPEVLAARSSAGDALRFGVGHAWNVLTALTSPGRMARRARWAAAHRFADIGQVQAPALVITGEDRLDRVVPTGLTRAFLRLLPNARAETLERTGHIGLVTRPDAFAELLSRFAATCLPGHDTSTTRHDGRRGHERARASA
jgi:pimeloyl-ACP methyl ester carboxylesterase